MQYVAFLRGINVGGNSKVPMDQLKKTLEKYGYLHVRTLLNSGNIVFESEVGNENLANKIEDQLEAEFGWRVGVIIRNSDQIKKLIKNDPFKEVQVTDETRLYVTFLADKEIYNVLTISDSQKTTDLMKNLEKEHGKKITTRNWNTVLKVGKLFSS